VFPRCIAHGHVGLGGCYELTPNAESYDTPLVLPPCRRLSAPASGAPRFEPTDLSATAIAASKLIAFRFAPNAKGTALRTCLHASRSGSVDSRDGGRTWSGTGTLRTVSEGGVGDASPLLDANNGRVWCFHSCGPSGIGFVEAKPGAATGPQTLRVHVMYRGAKKLWRKETLVLSDNVI